MNFITTLAGKFRDGGNRFRFIGVNNYPLIKSEYTRAQIDSFFDYNSSA